uniref:(northern house mosquito) hypothetical protein n=1 Tax=Culex pipiens TaxID=7175 RepID=A0A8D8NJX7_CULPI
MHLYLQVPSKCSFSSSRDSNGVKHRSQRNSSGNHMSTKSFVLFWYTGPDTRRYSKSYRSVRRSWKSGLRMQSSTSRKSCCFAEFGALYPSGCGGTSSSDSGSGKALT